MSTVSEKINSVMLSALSKNAKSLNRKINEIQIGLSLNTDGELVCEIISEGQVRIKPSLSQLIGTMYSIMAKGRLKKILLDQENRLSVKRGAIYIYIMTEDGTNITATIFNNGISEKVLCMADII